MARSVCGQRFLHVMMAVSSMPRARGGHHVRYDSFRSSIYRHPQYGSRLGLRLTSGSPTDDHAEFDSEAVRVMLDTEELILKLDRSWQRPTGGHAIALAFQCSIPAEVDDLFSLLTSHGAPAKQQPWDAFWEQRYASVLDPDDNQVDLFCPL